jgi:F0F1-type ATP synthase assembly protein I
MGWLITKYLITATVIVAASELAKRSDKLGALIVALPTVTILTMIWLYVEKQPAEKIANHAWYTFWYVLLTLPMFLLFPVLMQRYSFWLSLFISSIVTIVCFWLFSLLLKQFGINLLP